MNKKFIKTTFAGILAVGLSMPTYAATLYYKDNPFFGVGDGKLKSMYVKDCNTSTVLWALGLNKLFAGCSN